jgi:metal-responsive CopG/Arc/MetJ family transcriptional regulator
VPRIRITVPDALLQAVASAAEERGTSIDALYAEALTRYVSSTAGSSPGSLRSKLVFPRNSPTLAVELPEELYRSADQAARRLGKRREVLYADAVVNHLKLTATADSGFDRGHDLPDGAWRAKPPS